MPRFQFYDLIFLVHVQWVGRYLFIRWNNYFVAFCEGLFTSLLRQMLFKKHKIRTRQQFFHKVRTFWKAIKTWNNLPLDLTFTKGQLISKFFFGVFNFLQKTNENKSHISKIEFVCLTIRNHFIHRSQYINIKIPLHKQSENVKMCY